MERFLDNPAKKGLNGRKRVRQMKSYVIAEKMMIIKVRAMLVRRHPEES